MKKVAQIIGLVVIAVGILVAVALLLKKYFAKKKEKENDDCGIDDLDEFEPDDECDGDCDDYKQMGRKVGEIKHHSD